MISIKKLPKKAFTKMRSILMLTKCRLYIAQNGYVEDFVYKNRKIKLYLSEYNCGINCKGRLTERSLELALAKEWESRLNDEYIEIGAVTSYYGADFQRHSVIDPADTHEKVNIKDSLFNYNFSGKNVLSISTIEHVGTGEYGLTKAEDCIDALNKILKESKACFVSFPMGYNKKLDTYAIGGGLSEWLIVNQEQVSVCIYGRSKYGNDWRILDRSQKYYTEYTYGPLWANYVCFIEKEMPYQVQ